MGANVIVVDEEAREAREAWERGVVMITRWMRRLVRLVSDASS